MKVTQYFIFTYKNISSDIKCLCNKFVIKSGFIEQISSGIYAYYPIFIKIINNISEFIKFEISKIGFIEILLPIIQSKNLFKTSDRLKKFKSELFYLNKNKNFILTPTNEEIIIYLFKNKLTFYNYLNLNFYQINYKFRNELRVNFGLTRCKEFLMKDGYSIYNNLFDSKKKYEDVYNCYINIFNKLNLSYKVLLTKDYLMGGFISHEFFSFKDFVLTLNIFKFCYLFNFLKNIILSSLNIYNIIYHVYIPNNIILFFISNYLKLNIVNFLKPSIFINNLINNKISFLYILTKCNLIFSNKKFCTRLINFFELNKFFNIYYSYIGVNLKLKIKIFIDKTVFKLNFFLFTFNKKNYILNVLSCNFFYKIDKNHKNINGLEIAHIFQLNNYYSKKFSFKIKGKDNNLMYCFINSYGIGISRLISILIEQNLNNKGIFWPKIITPFKIVICPIGYNYIKVIKKFSDKIYYQFLLNKINVLLDDRVERIGVILNDWDLLGIPYKVIISEKNIRNGYIEYIYRKYLFSVFVNFKNFNKIFKKFKF